MLAFLFITQRELRNIAATGKVEIARLSVKYDFHDRSIAEPDIERGTPLHLNFSSRGTRAIK